MQDVFRAAGSDISSELCVTREKCPSTAPRLPSTAIREATCPRDSVSRPQTYPRALFEYSVHYIIKCLYNQPSSFVSTKLTSDSPLPFSVKCVGEILVEKFKNAVEAFGSITEILVVQKMLFNSAVGLKVLAFSKKKTRREENWAADSGMSRAPAAFHRLLIPVDISRGLESNRK